MRIAIASDGAGPEKVAVQAGRARYYLVYDEDRTLVETVANPFATGGGGAGFGVAKMLADKGVTTVIAGKFGGNMEGAMTQRGLTFIVSSDTVEAALEAALH